MLLLISKKKNKPFSMLCCPNIMSRNNTSNWFEHKKIRQWSLAWPGLTPSVTPVETVPRQPAPRLPPCRLILQNSWETCRSLKWIHRETSCRGFPTQPQKSKRSFTSTKLPSFFPGLPSHHSTVMHHADMSGIDRYPQTHTDHTQTCLKSCGCTLQ